MLVIYPGAWTEPEAVTDADAPLITHEHSDHLDPERLAGLGVQIFGPADANMSGLDWHQGDLRRGVQRSRTGAGETL